MISPVQLRHLLHKNPELSFREFKTTEILFEQLLNLDKIKIHKPLKTGLLVEYTINESDYILFRADIDALPIQENTSVEFASENENMHACGHDVHSSILYGFIQKVIELKFNKNILFLFQPAEESGGGAAEIIKSKILEKFNISKAVALHVTDEYPQGTVASTSGILFVSSVEINLEIIGKESHVAFPGKGINSFLALRKFLDEIDQLVKNFQEPVLFGCGKVASGRARNIIPAKTTAEITLRTLTEDKLNSIIEKMINSLDKIKSEFKTDYKMSISQPYSEVMVEEGLYKKYSKCLGNNFTFIDCGYKMTAEDFGLFSKIYPSFMFWLGSKTGESFGLHTPEFLPDDSTIELGIKAFTNLLNCELTK